VTGEGLERIGFLADRVTEEREDRMRKADVSSQETESR
jgi:hypothetical protein